MWLGDKLREMVKSWLNIRPAQGQAFVINEDMDHQASKNKEISYWASKTNSKNIS